MGRIPVKKEIDKKHVEHCPRPDLVEGQLIS